MQQLWYEQYKSNNQVKFSKAQSMANSVSLIFGTLFRKPRSAPRPRRLFWHRHHSIVLHHSFWDPCLMTIAGATFASELDLAVMFIAVGIRRRQLFEDF
jgi:hypothetical protein